MKHRVCMLLNNFDEYDFEDLVNQYLPASLFDVVIANKFPDVASIFDIIVPWSYKKIIKQAEHSGNVVVFHSSNLPEGRGWAPIYYSFSENKSEYVISGILARNEVDTGNIIIRATFPIISDYTATFIRKIDKELSLILIAQILKYWPDGDFKGEAQIGAGSYRKRRYPEDNEIDISQPFFQLVPHLRGVEKNNPAFFFLNKTKYLIEIRPECEPNKPSEVMIELPALNLVIKWTEWRDSP